MDKALLISTIKSFLKARLPREFFNLNDFSVEDDKRPGFDFVLRLYSPFFRTKGEHEWQSSEWYSAFHECSITMKELAKLLEQKFPEYDVKSQYYAGISYEMLFKKKASYSYDRRGAGNPTGKTSI